MKMFVAGVKDLTGTSTKSGAPVPFAMPRVFGLVPVENFTKPNVQSRGYGFQPSECDLDPACIEAFAKINFPAHLDLETDVVQRFGEYQTVVIGIKAVLPAVVPVAAPKAA